jgi:hypothetical protein
MLSKYIKFDSIDMIAYECSPQHAENVLDLVRIVVDRLSEAPESLTRCELVVWLVASVDTMLEREEGYFVQVKPEARKVDAGASEKLVFLGSGHYGKDRQEDVLEMEMEMELKLKEKDRHRVEAEQHQHQHQHRHQQQQQQPWRYFECDEAMYDFVDRHRGELSEKTFSSFELHRRMLQFHVENGVHVLNRISHAVFRDFLVHEFLCNVAPSRVGSVLDPCVSFPRLYFDD